MNTKVGTKRTAGIADIRRKFGALELSWTPGPSDPHAGSAALAVTVALLRALRDRGLLTEGEIGDVFGDAAELLRGSSALNLLNRVRFWAEHKDEE